MLASAKCVLLDFNFDASVDHEFEELSECARIDVLVIDDWAMAPLSEHERRDFWEICEERYQVRSTVLTSQLPVSRWHKQIGDPTLANGILDRLVHNAHRIEMRGTQCAKNRGKSNAEAHGGDLNTYTALS
jgi:DNA replication protein DnaC